MNDWEHLLDDTNLRAAAIARLLTLIERDSEIINRHRAAGDPGTYVQQYIDLRETNLLTLARLLEANGAIRADLCFSEQAA